MSNKYQEMRAAIARHKDGKARGPVPPPPPGKPRPPAPAAPEGPPPRNPRAADAEMHQFPRYPDGTFFVSGWKGGKWLVTLRVPYPRPDGRTDFKEFTGEDDRFHRLHARVYRAWLAYDRSLKTAAPSASPPGPS